MSLYSIVHSLSVFHIININKIKGMENLNYHERLIKLNLYSLERRRERFMIINAWEQLEGIKENVLRLQTG